MTDKPHSRSDGSDGNPLKTALSRALSDNEPVAGNWISVGHTTVAEITALLDFDFGLVDIEHTAISIETVQQIVYAIESADGPTQTVVRVPENDFVPIKQVLDMGATGIMVPMIETASAAEQVVEAVRYPPEGSRGIAGSRATGFGREFPEYVSEANEEIVTIVQIETETGISNAREIAAVDGVDALFVGPADLTSALGVFGEWDSENFCEALEEVVSQANDVETPVGTLVVGDQTQRFVEIGLDFLIVGKDASYLIQGAVDAKRSYERTHGRVQSDLTSEH